MQNCQSLVITALLFSSALLGIFFKSKKKKSFCKNQASFTQFNCAQVVKDCKSFKKLKLLIHILVHLFINRFCFFLNCLLHFDKYENFCSNKRQFKCKAICNYYRMIENCNHPETDYECDKKREREKEREN